MRGPLAGALKCARDSYIRRMEYEEDIPAGLHERVMRRLDLERQRAALRRRFMWAFSASSGAAGLAVPVWRTLRTAFAQSGFWAYASLVFSDARVVFASWQDFGIGVLESLPAVPIIAALALALVLLIAIRFAITYGAAWRTIAAHSF